MRGFVLPELARKSGKKAPRLDFLPGFKWVSTLALAGLTLLLSSASHGESPALGLVAIGLLTGTLVAVFLTAAAWALDDANPRAVNIESSREGRAAAQNQASGRL